MKAAVMYDVGDLRLDDLPEPEPGHREVLIRVRASGLCGTDVHMYEGKNKEGTFPFIPGHEWAGEVMKLGPQVTSVQVGDRVMGDSFIPCGVCDVCKESINSAYCPNHQAYGFSPEYSGGMCEYLKSPEKRLFKLADNMSFEEGALVENVSVPYTGIWRIAGGVAPHDRVAIFGAGPIGLMAMLIAKAAHAQTIVVETLEFRRKMVEEMGAEAVIDPTKEDPVERIRHYTGGKGATLIVECSGSDQAIAATMDASALEGRILLVGHSIGRKVAIEIGKMIWKGTKIVATCAAPGYFPKVIDYMARKPFDFTRAITHRFPLTSIMEAINVGLQYKKSMKIMILP